MFKALSLSEGSRRSPSLLGARSRPDEACRRAPVSGRLFPEACLVADLVAAGKLRPVADRSGLRHLLGDIELFDETLRHDAVSGVRPRPAIARGALADLQALDRLALDQGGECAGGLAVTRLTAFRRVDDANPDADLFALRLHREGIAPSAQDHPRRHGRLLRVRRAAGQS